MNDNSSKEEFLLIYNDDDYDNQIMNDNISFMFKTQYDSSQHIPNYSGENGLYFSSKSVMLMFI